MNKVEVLADLMGGKRALAEIIGRHPSVVTRMVRDGKVRPEFNQAIRDHVSAAVRIVPSLRDNAAKALDCLEPDVCPTCGQVVPHGTVL